MANESVIRPSALPVERSTPAASEFIVVDNGVAVARSKISDVVGAGRPLANQTEAEAGVNATKAMTPLTTKQAIDAQVPGIVSAAIDGLDLGTASQEDVEAFATAAQGATADSAVQPADLADVATSGAYGDLSGLPTLGTVGTINLPDSPEGRVLGDGGEWVAAGSGDTLTFFSSLAMEQAEDRLTGPVSAGPGGNGFFDGFNVLTYVDVAGAVNLSTSVAGELGVAMSSNVTNGAHTMDANIAGWDGYTIRNRVNAAVLTHSGSSVRLTLTGPTAGAPAVIGAMYIGQAAASGDAYDFAATPTQITVGGSGSFTVGVGQVVVTDWIDFTLNEAQNYVTSFYVTSGDLRYKNGTSPDYATYSRAGNEAATVNATTGYNESPSRDIAMVSKIEVSSISDMSVESQNFNFLEVPQWGRIVAIVDLAGAALNTDLIFSISRDGSDFVMCAMGERYVRPDGSVLVDSGLIDLSATDSGMTGRWRITTDNGASPRILAVGALFGEA